MPDPVRQPHLFFQTGIRWRNKHLNLDVQVARLYDAWNRWLGDTTAPATRPWEPGLEALRAIVRTAEADGKRTRALGGAWSLSDAAVTQDYLVNTKPLNHCRIGLLPELCAPTCPVPPDRLVFAQCGISVLELSQVLEARGLSLRTSGASNGQTLCGAVSTGTHGAANQVGSMPDCIHGLHIVAEHGDHYWIQRKSQPVVSAELPAILGATLVEDDDLFNAALVGFGSFGLVHALLLEVEPIYSLERYAAWYDYADVQDVINDLDVSRLKLVDGDALPFHFEVVINPYANTKAAYVNYMYKRAYTPWPSAQPPVVAYRTSHDVITLIGDLTDLLPSVITSAIVGPLVNSLATSQLTPITKQIGTHSQTFGGTDLRGRVLSCELGVPLDRTRQAVEIILPLVREHSFAGLVALRWVKPSRATLAFTRFAPYTCTIELPGSYSDLTKGFYAAVWKALSDAGIPLTFHWGQLLPQDPASIRQAWGTAVDAWLAARRRFLPGSGRATFSNDMLQKCGLDK